MFIKVFIGIFLYMLLIFFEIFLMVKMLDFLCKSFVGISLSEFCNKLISKKDMTNKKEFNNKDIFREDNKLERYLIIDKSGRKWQINSDNIISVVNSLPFDSTCIRYIEIIGYIDKMTDELITYNEPKTIFKEF